MIKEEIEDSEAKKRFILPALMLCLLQSWTIGGCPKSDLRDLRLDLATVKNTIDELIKRELVYRYSRCASGRIVIDQIFNFPQRFVEAEVLTPRGQEIANENNLEKLKSLWLDFLRREVR